MTGRVEADESLADAAKRDAKEEIGFDVETDPPFFVCPTADGTHELHFMRARCLGGTPTPAPQEVAAGVSRLRRYGNLRPVSKPIAWRFSNSFWHRSRTPYPRRDVPAARVSTGMNHVASARIQVGDHSGG